MFPYKPYIQPSSYQFHQLDTNQGNMGASNDQLPQHTLSAQDNDHFCSSYTQCNPHQTLSNFQPYSSGNESGLYKRKKCNKPNRSSRIPKSTKRETTLPELRKRKKQCELSVNIEHNVELKLQNQLLEDRMKKLEKSNSMVQDRLNYLMNQVNQIQSKLSTKTQSTGIAPSRGFEASAARFKRDLSVDLQSLSLQRRPHLQAKKMVVGPVGLGFEATPAEWNQICLASINTISNIVLSLLTSYQLGSRLYFIMLVWMKLKQSNSFPPHSSYSGDSH